MIPRLKSPEEIERSFDSMRSEYLDQSQKHCIDIDSISSSYRELLDSCTSDIQRMIVYIGTDIMIRQIYNI